jgi:hypothetical protein
MKKITLLFAFAVSAFAANAQLTLTGTSYTQNFDNLTSSGIPTGWHVYNAATATSLGTLDLTYSNSTTWGTYYDTVGCPADVFGHGFKNCASANVASMATATCAIQEAATDRALGVRQASNTTYPGFDPGPSFALELANTTGDSSFQLVFKLQSLDQNCPRTTKWTLDYGIGATPTVFTPITTTGTMTTGNYTFSNDTITATLPSAINNLNQPVWLRISTLQATTGSGSRTTSAIDDFSLTWVHFTSSGISNIPSSEPKLSMYVLGNPSSDNISLVYNSETGGNYSLIIYDITSRMLHSSEVHANVGDNVISIKDLHLTSGIYIARIGNSNSSSVARIVIP